MAEIKTLSDATLTKFVSGGDLVVQGHKLEPADIRIMYSFAGDKSAELSQKYEADSSEDILVLLDTTPDASMLEEGFAREVVNRVQKFRKSGGLKVADEVTMYYSVSPADHTLAGIITNHLDYIQTSSKTPLRQKTSGGLNISKTETFEVKGAKLELNIVPGFPAGYSGGEAAGGGGGTASPALPWVNVELLGCTPAKYIGSSKGGLLLPKPEEMTINKLTSLVQVYLNVSFVK